MSKLYVSDLDGTLLRSDATLSAYSRERLSILLEQGLQFTIASARSIVTIKQILGDLPLKLPIIEFNGSFVSDYQTGKHYIINHIEQRLTQKIYELGLQQQLIPFISTYNGQQDCLYYGQLQNEGMNWYYQSRVKAADPRLQKGVALELAVDDQVVCFTFIAQEHVLRKLDSEVQALFPEQLSTHLYENMYSLGWHWLTIHARLSSKAQAIGQVLKQLGKSEQDLVVFGDEINDLHMFELAGTAVAVQNGIEALKQQADKIIGSNDQDSVVKYIEQDFYAQN